MYGGEAAILRASPPYIITEYYVRRRGNDFETLAAIHNNNPSYSFIIYVRLCMHVRFYKCFVFGLKEMQTRTRVPGARVLLPSSVKVV